VQGVRRTLPDLSIRQLEYLVAVSEAPNWAAAASKVGVSASALSQGLAELERRVGVPLFDREGRRRVLRPSAHEVLAHARQVVALTGDLAEWVDRVRTGHDGTLRVGMIDAAAVGHFPEVLRRFRLEHPELDFRLRVAPSSQLLDELVLGDLDLIVCVESAEPRRGITTQPLLTEDLAVFAPGGRPSPDPAEWGPWVLFAVGSHTRDVIDGVLRELGCATEIVAESNQPEVLRAMVGLGVGWTVLPVVQSNPDLGVGRVVASRRLVIANREGSPFGPAARMLEEQLRA